MTTKTHEPQGEALLRRKKRSLWSDAWLRMRRSHTAVIGMVMFAIILVVCYGAPFYIDYETQVIGTDLTMVRKFPAEGHLLGTDEVGRDILARIIWGGRTSITIALCATVVSSALGILLGSISAYYGGKTDSLIMRTLDIFMAIPSMLLMITLVSVMKPTTFNLIMAMAVSGVPSISRIVRGQMMSVLHNEYIEAVHGMGASPFRIVLKHALPNAISPLISQIVSSVAGEITLISSLSYIGLGVQPPAPEWGAMLSAGQQYLRNQPYLTMFPGIAIVITIISLTLMGDGLRDALDPRMKR
jgi:peptide/nickel transport system permease protein